MDQHTALRLLLAVYITRAAFQALFIEKREVCLLATANLRYPMTRISVMQIVYIVQLGPISANERIIPANWSSHIRVFNTLDDICLVKLSKPLKKRYSSTFTSSQTTQQSHFMYY